MQCSILQHGRQLGKQLVLSFYHGGLQTKLIKDIKFSANAFISWTNLLAFSLAGVLLIDFLNPLCPSLELMSSSGYLPSLHSMPVLSITDPLQQVKGHFSVLFSCLYQLLCSPLCSVCLSVCLGNGIYSLLLWLFSFTIMQRQLLICHFPDPPLWSLPWWLKSLIFHLTKNFCS